MSKKHKRRAKVKKELKRWVKVKGRLKARIPVLVTGLVAVIVLSVTLFFPSFFEAQFKLFPNLSGIEEQSFELHVVDVGQGDAMLVRFSNGQTLLVDSGPVSGRKNLFSYIDNIFFKNFTPHFNYVLLTHSDADHSGNMLEVLNTYSVDAFYRPAIFSQNVEGETTESSQKIINSKMYDAIITKLNQLQAGNKTQVVFNAAGLVLENGGLLMAEFLSPNVASYSSTNDYSPIIMLYDNGRKIMLTGDAGELVEQEVLNNYMEYYLSADILKLGHHGSKFSTTQEFLRVVNPDYAFINVGKNSYGHPSDEVWARVVLHSQERESGLKNNVLNTLEHHNFIYHVNDGAYVGVLLVGAVDDYLFMQWFEVYIIIVGVIVVVTIAYGLRLQSGRASNI